MVRRPAGRDRPRDDLAARDGPVPHDAPRKLQARRVLRQQGLRLEPHRAVFRRVALDERHRVRAPDGRRVPCEETGAPVRRFPPRRREAQGLFASAPRRRRDLRLVALRNLHAEQGQAVSRHGAHVRGYAVVRTVRGEFQGARERAAGRPARILREGSFRADAPLD